jgi:hypothetical protein
MPSINSICCALNQTDYGNKYLVPLQKNGAEVTSDIRYCWQDSAAGTANALLNPINANQFSLINFLPPDIRSISTDYYGLAQY